MKTKLKNWILPLAFVLTNTLISNAQAYLQDPKFGPNEEARQECAANLSLYQEYYNQRNYNQAKKHWMNVLKNCPAARQNTYVHGVRMVKTWIEEEPNPMRKNVLIDSLMMIYDMRIEYFGNRGVLLGQKGVDLVALDPERYEEAYNLIAESIETEKEGSSVVVIFTYMNLTKTMYDNSKIEAEKVIETYSLLADYLDIQIKEKPDDIRCTQVKENVDAIFSSAGVANCDNLITIFEPRVNANPSDIALVNKTYNLLSANRCEETPFYRQVSEILYNNEPTSSRAYELAKIYTGLREFKKGEKFYQDAIKLESDSIRKSVYLVEYANIMCNEYKNPQQARTLALQAIDENPNLGHAYMLIGNLYASEKNCGADDFEKRTVYWAAVDKFIKAKQVDPNLTEDCDRLIGIYTQYFPAQQDIFFQDLEPGARYTVKCWINETTTVRARP
jgi:hypothetical protein